MPIVEVQDWQVKPGAVGKIIELMQKLPAQWQPPQGTPKYLSVRTYAPSAWRFVVMVEWSSLADAEQFYAAFWADPVSQEYSRGLDDLVVYSRGSEYWMVLETWIGSQEA